MPMFHDPEKPLDELGKRGRPPVSDMIERRISEESIRTEFCEGPVPDDVDPVSPELTSQEQTASSGVETSDRAELIERLKRGESPTWVPNRTVCVCQKALTSWRLLSSFYISSESDPYKSLNLFVPASMV